MSSQVAQIITKDRVTAALARIGIVPFVASEDHIGLILPASRTMRFVIQPNRPMQAVAEWPRIISSAHAEAVQAVAHQINSSTYIPKVTVTVEDPRVVVRLQHTFHWAAGITDAQLEGELQQFIRAALGAMQRLDAAFVDPFSPGATAGSASPSSQEAS